MNLRPLPSPLPFSRSFLRGWASAHRLDFEGVCLRQFSANRLQTWQSYYSNLKALFPAESTDFRLLVVHVKSSNQEERSIKNHSHTKLLLESKVYSGRYANGEFSA